MIRKSTAALIEENGKYLIGKRKPGGAQGNRWEFPGGKVDGQETPQQGLLRELYEEFEIAVEVGDFVISHRFNNGDKQYELMVFRVKHLSGDFKLNEHQEIRWVTPAEFGKYEFAESDQAVIDQIF